MGNRCTGVCESVKGGARLSLLSEVSGANSIFLDTAPIIYYIEAHQDYGPLMKELKVIVLADYLDKNAVRWDQ